jgi:putative hemolysin
MTTQRSSIETNDPNRLAGLAVQSSAGRQPKWLEGLLFGRLVGPQRDAGRATAVARRLLGFTRLNNLLAQAGAGAGEQRCRLAALAQALDLRIEFEGLEHLAAAADRPIILFGNHPTGGGNVLGMSLLLANRFSDYRILGNRHMKFLSSLSDSMIAVDPFRSDSPMNLEALLKLRREFGTKYRALGVFPAGISSQLNLLRGTISDRPWSDAFVRIARHHDALLIPVWFSGRNRLRYYLAARIRTELGFLALPAEFLRLRGTTMTVIIGRPISRDDLRRIPDRRAQLSFLRACVYGLPHQQPTDNSDAELSQ